MNDHLNVSFEWKGKEQAKIAAEKVFSPRIERIQFDFQNKTPNSSDDTHYQYFMGENLHILSHLLTEYTDRVQLAFFDPPYNSTQDKIVELTDDSKRSGTKPDKISLKVWENGMKRNRWLSFIYARLILVHRLLDKNTGILAFCIDDKEIGPVRLILDEIFGQMNFIGTILWQSMKGSKKQVLFTHNHTNIVLYAKNKQSLQKSGVYLGLQTHLANGKDEALSSIWTHLPDSIESRNKMIDSLNDVVSPDILRFLNPKPLAFLRRILQLTTQSEGKHFILDPFAGTGSMIAATLAQNLADGGNREVLSIQYPLPLTSFSPNSSSKPDLTIPDLAKIRIDQFIQDSQNIVKTDQQ